MKSRPTAIVTLTGHADIFAGFQTSVARWERDVEKIVVTSQAATIDAPGWTVLAGEEPFIFARNANIGLRAAGADTDVLLINDDCRLVQALTPTLKRFGAYPWGILSPVIIGDVGNPLQRAGTRAVPPGTRVYPSTERLAFVSVFLPASTRAAVGLLDERYTGYGGDDRDYCHRLVLAGLRMGIVPQLKVMHGAAGHRASSSFLRSMTDEQRVASMAEMDRVFREKFGL